MIALTIAGFIVLRLAAQFWLDGLNRRRVCARADSVPAAFKAALDETTYARSVEYTLAKSRLSQLLIGICFLDAARFSGRSTRPYAQGLPLKATARSPWIILSAIPGTMTCL